MSRRVPYTNDFYSEHAGGALDSARVVTRHLRALGIKTDGAVVDVGCGRGHWLEAFAEAGATTLVGIDGPWNQAHFTRASPVEFVSLDLGEAGLTSVELVEAVHRQHFDVGVCTEVLEHLPETSADAVIEMLSTLARVVVFSAAIPGQGGRGHRNERWQSHWAACFEQRGFCAYDLIRPLMWADTDVDFWYRQNLVLYAVPEVFPERAPTAAAALDIVHPDLFEHRLVNPRVRDWPRGTATLVARGMRAALTRLRR
jgi:SAM-dependent methyltransferase